MAGPDRKLVPEPAGPATVRKIFDLYCHGLGYKAIAGELNLEGRLISVGGPWYQRSIFGILTNEKYAGIYAFNKRSAAREYCKRDNHLYKPDADVIRLPG